MQIGSLAKTAHNALSGINSAIRGIEDVAESVASASSETESGDFSQKISSIATLPVHELHAKANAKVFETTLNLFDTLASLRKK
jgi:hypothetical protein